MGSLRNPVGPLPSSIYWRRRAVAASLVALLALLIVWFVSSGDDGGKKGGDGSDGAAPATSITPGPSRPGAAISEQPGGRDESGAGGGDDGGKNGDTSSPGAGGDGGGAGAGAGPDAGTGSGAGTGGGTGAGGATTGSGGTTTGERVPANSPLPDCAPGSVRLTLRSLKVSYTPDEKPRFQLVARNTSPTTCKTDLGATSAVLTIKNAEADQVWSSKDCPRGSGTLLLRVPAGGSVTHTVEWDRRPSAPRCATPPATAAGPGTYLVEAAVPGVKVLPASFTLTKD
ncbi:hypothetical protein [Streptomyces lavendofoliae]|uniref:Uncharacterized protein n=1 Tax=Streptomyces lavendofoliae TaxID=67314 RepID=A0A918HUU8_9ACTN|nr:hypothetical protein [Streptomyces lavendofoliae]GGU30548.1 hypothetical protein GCM10010274_16970 [Streptomyces lavendofoliae]